eukprot:PITA_08354
MARTQGFPLVFLSAFFICVLQGAAGAIFEIQNNCRFTVWAADSLGGGKWLDSGQSWRVQVANGTTGGRFWGRTGCSFNGNGRGSCNTGDCGGLLNCQGSGNPPATMVEYSLNQYQNSNFYDISVIDGFNLPKSIIPSNPSCNAVTCSSNISAICPVELRVYGCDNACTRFNTSQYCCTGKYLNNCRPTNYSMVFKRQCPQAYTFTYAGSTDYKVVFCGGNATSLQGQFSIPPCDHLRIIE